MSDPRHESAGAANPFTPPSARVEDLASVRPERPVGVVVIAIFYLATAFLALASRYLLLARPEVVPPSLRLQWQGLSWLANALFLVVSALKIGGAVGLLRRRGYGFVLLAILFAIGLVRTLWLMLAGNWLRTVTVPGLIGAGFNLVLSAALLLYLWRLRRRGVL